MNTFYVLSVGSYVSNWAFEELNTCLMPLSQEINKKPVLGVEKGKHQDRQSIGSGLGYMDSSWGKGWPVSLEIVFHMNDMDASSMIKHDATDL